MANISDAFGSVTIYAVSLEVIRRILSAHEKGQEAAYYETTITNEFSENRKNTPASHETNSGTVYELPGAISVEFGFTGSGRWNFMTNVKWFIDEILEADPSLKNTAFGAIFEFSDAEPGCGFIYNCVMKTEYAPDTGVITSVLEESDEVSYTVENLVDFGFYGIDEVFDQEWILNNRETVLDELDNLLEYDNSSRIEKINFIAKHPDVFFEFIEDSESYGVVEYLPDLLEMYIEEFDIKEVMLNQIDNINSEKDIFHWMDLHKIEIYDSFQGSLIDNFVVWLPAELSAVLDADVIFFKEEFRTEWSSSYIVRLLSKEDACELIDEVELD